MTDEKSAIKKGGLASVASGAASGAMISICVQPFDVVKTTMQSNAARGAPSSMAAVMSQVLHAGGWRAFWQGTQPTVIRLSLGAGMHFFLLERLKTVMLARHQWKGPAETSVTTKPTTLAEQQKLSHSEAAFVGMPLYQGDFLAYRLWQIGLPYWCGASRALATALLCPLTVIKTRMELGAAGRHQYRNTVDAVVKIARTERIAGLFRGIVPTMLANAPFSALYYMGYTHMQEQLRGKLPTAPTYLVNFSAGVSAAAVATVITQPADVVRAQMQLSMAGAQQGSLGVATSIWGRQGARALLTGFGPRVVKRTLQTALVWTMYEALLPKAAAVGACASQLFTVGRRAGPDRPSG